MSRMLNRQIVKCVKSAGIGTRNNLPAVGNPKKAEFSGLPQFHRTGLFGIAELESYLGFMILKQKCLDDTDRLINEAISAERTRKLVEILDELSDTVCRAADLSEFVRIAHPCAAYRQAAEDTCLTAYSIVEKLNTHVGLYEALKKTVERGDVTSTSQFDEHVAGLFLADFERSGIQLSKKERQMIVQLNDQIVYLGQRFTAGSYEPRLVHRKLIPRHLHSLFLRNGDKVIVNGVSSDANPLAREATYKLFYQFDRNQDQLLDSLLAARNRLANICGFKTYAERALALSLVEKPSVVTEFLDILSKQLRIYVDADVSIMRKLKRGDEPIAMWDVQYYSDKIRKDRFKVSALECAPYFSLGACMQGLSNLFYRLFRIKFVSATTLPGETWAPDIYKLAVVHDIEGVLGYIYCDFHPREEKPNQDCHYTICSGRTLPGGSYQLPVVVVMLNVPPPNSARPSLLSPAMVDNLFHEMGHAMHSMLARTRYQHVSGTRCSNDLSEVPSILMEHFAGDPRVLRSFARHFETKEPMPAEMLQRLCASKRLFAASKMQAQVFYAALDQAYHGPHPLGMSTTQLLAEIQKKYYSLPYVKHTSWQLRFGHLVGYGATYYSYLVARAVATKIWQTYFQKDPFNGVAGEKYRRECLAHGGGKPPKEVIGFFLKDEPTARTLAEALIVEVHTSQDSSKFHYSSL